MHDIAITPPEVTEQLKIAYRRAGARKSTKLQWICRYPPGTRKWWQRKHYFIDVDTRELVACMLHTDAEGHIYRERGGGKKHLIRARWSDLHAYEQNALQKVFDRS